MKSKKQKDLGVNVSNFETYIRYFGVAGEKQKSNKNLRRWFAFSNSLKEAIWKNNLGNPVLSSKNS